jgi:hypothetical protein
MRSVLNVSKLKSDYVLFYVVIAIGKLPTKKGNNGKMSVALGNGAMAARISLEDKILVRVQVPQLDPLEIAGFCFKRVFNMGLA